MSSFIFSIKLELNSICVVIRISSEKFDRAKRPKFDFENFSSLRYPPGIRKNVFVFDLSKRGNFSDETTFFLEGPIETHILTKLGRKNTYSDQIRPISKSVKLSPTYFCNGDYALKTRHFLKKKSIKM